MHTVRLQRQNTLLVPTIQSISEVGVDKHLSLEGGHRKIKNLLKILIGSYFYENSWTENHRTYWFHILSIFQHKVDLGIEENPDIWDQTLFKMISHNTLDKNTRPAWVTQSNLFPSEYEYYGIILKKDFKLPKILERRRKSKTHFQRYIGVGYKDKGATTESSQDGNHPWQEVVGKLSALARRTDDLMSIWKSLEKVNIRRSIAVGKPRFLKPTGDRLHFFAIGSKEKDTVLGFEYDGIGLVPEEFRLGILKVLKAKYTNGKQFLFEREISSESCGREYQYFSLVKS